MPKKKILIVDDEANLTRMLKHSIESKGKYEVREENSSTQACSSAQYFQPDLILLDVMMPGIDGFNIATQIQENESLKHIPIVFLTSIIHREEVEDIGSKIGGITFLAKPVKLDALILCIEEKLEE